jgi:hypothetical protein
MTIDRLGVLFFTTRKVGCVCPKRVGRKVYCRLGNNNCVNNNDFNHGGGRSRRNSNRRKHLDQSGKAAFPFKNSVMEHVSKNNRYS